MPESYNGPAAPSALIMFLSAITSRGSVLIRLVVAIAHPAAFAVIGRVAASEPEPRWTMTTPGAKADVSVVEMLSPPSASAVSSGREILTLPVPPRFVAASPGSGELATVSAAALESRIREHSPNLSQFATAKMSMYCLPANGLRITWTGTWPF